MAIGGPIPDTSLAVANYNFQSLDKFSNSTDNTYLDRFDTERYTLTGFYNLVVTAIDNAEVELADRIKWWQPPSETDPATAFGGAPLETGMSYLNTADGAVKWYDGTGWQYVESPRALIF